MCLGDPSIGVCKKLPHSLLQLSHIPVHLCPIIDLTNPHWMAILSYPQSFANTNLVPVLFCTLGSISIGKK